MTSSLSVRDNIRREMFLARLSLWLDDYPGAEKRVLLRQLRGELDLAAGDTSMTDAVASLGSPRTLAREYRTILPAGRPRWPVGLTWAAIALLTWWVLVGTFSAALLQVASLGGAGGVTGHLLWAEVTAVDTRDEISVAVTGHWIGLLVLLASFLAGSRAWRALRRHNRERADEA